MASTNTNTSTDTSTPQRIVVGVDGSHSSVLALRWAADEATLRQATLAVVHAWSDGNVGAGAPGSAFSVDIEAPQQAARAALDDVLASASLPAELRIERHAVMGPGATVLLEAAAGADLLVVGTRGRGGVAGLLLGSVSHACIREATCPVVVVPDAGS